MGAVRVPINGATLQWAREVGQVQASELARAVNVRVERIIEFEQGSAQPTFKQVLGIAKKLGRPAASFFCDQPTEPDVPKTVDFRGASGQLSPKLIKALKKLEEHRESFLELEPSIGSVKFKVDTSGTPFELAKATRVALGLTESFVPHARGKAQAFDYWRNLLGDFGILVFQTTGISLDEFRGLSVHHETLPMIVVNGADSYSGRVFTLFHELGHLLERTSGVCGSSEAAPVEVRCNQFAQEFLMPADVTRNLVLSGDFKAQADQVAKHFRVSILAAAIRLRSLGRISDDQVRQIKLESDLEWEVQRAKLRSSPGGPDWHRIRYRDLGSMYVGAVARGLESRSIGLLDATYLLDAKVPSVSKILEEHLRAGGQ